MKFAATSGARGGVPQTTVAHQQRRVQGSLGCGTLRGRAAKARAPVGRSLLGQCTTLVKCGLSFDQHSLRRGPWRRARQHSLGKLRTGAPAWLALGRNSYNWAIDTDPQQQVAAPPLMLVARSFLR
jgi:hypothetical protein